MNNGLLPLIVCLPSTESLLLLSVEFQDILGNEGKPDTGDTGADDTPAPASEGPRGPAAAGPSAGGGGGGGSKYVPPSMRDGGNKRGESMSKGGRGGENENNLFRDYL